MPSCEIEGHVFGSRGICVMCKTPKEQRYDCNGQPFYPNEEQPPSKDLVSQLRALPAGARLLGYTAAEHIERLETALRGIQSCSTCEACRGAATIALGGDQHNPSPSIRALAESAYKDGYGADLTDDRDLSERTHGLIRSLSRPSHEREMPHCSSCSCPPYEAPQPFEHPYAQHPHHVCTCGAKVPSDVYVLHTCGDRLTPKGSAPEPAVDRGTTHASDCWGWGPRHYACALAEIKHAHEVIAHQGLQLWQGPSQPPGAGQR